jgi:transcriptional regulator with XRE-family HTH domain
MSEEPPGSGAQYVFGVASQRHYSRANFARNLKALLGAHGLTGKEASALTGISANTISGWLTGQRDPSLPSMEKIASFFEVDAFKLLGQFTGSFLFEELANVERWMRVEDKLAGAEKSEVVPIKKKRKTS